MIISAQHQRAITAACKKQPVVPDSYSQRDQNRKAAIRKVRKKCPTLWAKLREAARKLQDAHKVEMQMRDVIRQTGLNDGLTNINDVNSFTGATGIKVAQISQRWTVDDVLARIAAAKPGNEKAILAEYGIIWE